MYCSHFDNYILACIVSDSCLTYCELLKPSKCLLHFFLCLLGENPDEIVSIVTAPTGTAAFNISGSTIHSSLHIPITNSREYKKLSDDKRNSLRLIAGKLRLMIIDEISMVGNILFTTIHERLCEIKNSSNLFGGVSILAFGDLYQLPPVKQQQIFKPIKYDVSSGIYTIWREFRVANLTTIMRQKEDQDFAQLLNRIRTASYTATDIATLQTRNKEFPGDKKNILYVFARNEDVNNHNTKMLNELPGQKIVIKSINNIPRGFKLSSSDIMDSGLPDSITLAINCRVMIIRNINTQDGLVNGVHGVVKHFVVNTKHHITAILILFADDIIGARARSQYVYPGNC